MANVTHIPQQNAEITLYEKMITKQLHIEVSNAIYDFVENHMNNLIEELAVDAVKAWSIQMQTQKRISAQNPYDNKTEIQINFVENLIKTIEVPNDIEIKVNK